MEIIQGIRRRTQVSTTAGGLHTYEATVEIVNGTLEEQVAELKALVSQMDALWPAVQKEPKK